MLVVLNCSAAIARTDGRLMAWACSIASMKASRPGVLIALDARCSGRQPIHDDARFAMPDERRASAHAHGRAACQQDFLKCQGSMVVIRQVSAGSRSTSGLEQLLASVASVVDLNVAREDFGQVLQRHGEMRGWAVSPVGEVPLK